MSTAERDAIEGHLFQAVDQLAKARILAAQLELDGRVGTIDRLRLNHVAASAGVLIEYIAGDIAGQDLERELLRILNDYELEE